MPLANQLDRILGQTSKVRILRFLIMTDSELNGREVAIAVGLSHVKCHTAMKELHQHGIVEMRRSGKSILYRLNLKNVLVGHMLIPLFTEEARLKEILKDILTKHLKRPVPKSVILFGSFALGGARPDSDIDMLIVASRKKNIRLFQEGLEKAEANITTGFGNHLAPIVMDAAEFKKRFKNKDKFVRSVVKEGKVLFGLSINDLIAAND